MIKRITNKLAVNEGQACLNSIEMNELMIVRCAFWVILSFTMIGAPIAHDFILENGSELELSFGAPVVLGQDLDLRGNSKAVTKHINIR